MSAPRAFPFGAPEICTDRSWTDGIVPRQMPSSWVVLLGTSRFTRMVARRVNKNCQMLWPSLQESSVCWTLCNVEPRRPLNAIGYHLNAPRFPGKVRWRPKLWRIWPAILFLSCSLKTDGEREQERKREREGSTLVQGAAQPGISRPPTSRVLLFLVPRKNSSTASSPGTTMETKTASGNGLRAILPRQIEIVGFQLVYLVPLIRRLHPMMWNGPFCVRKGRLWSLLQPVSSGETKKETEGGHISAA